MLHQSTISAGALITQILQALSVAQNIYQKLNYVRFSYVNLFKYEHLKPFV